MARAAKVTLTRGDEADRDYRDDDRAATERDDGPPPSASEEPDAGPYATPAPDQDPNR